MLLDMPSAGEKTFERYYCHALVRRAWIRETGERKSFTWGLTESEAAWLARDAILTDHLHSIGTDPLCPIDPPHWRVEYVDLMPAHVAYVIRIRRTMVGAPSGPA